MEDKVINGFFGEYRFLSNFWYVPINIAGIVYPTSEHAFQAAKFHDVLIKQQIASLKTPGDAKRAGKAFKPLREDWEEIKDQIMYEVLMLKFWDTTLRNKLLNTGNTVLIEGNTWGDTYWGVCNGVGQNKLGQTLMKVREFYEGFST